MLVLAVTENVLSPATFCYRLRKISKAMPGLAEWLLSVLSQGGIFVRASKGDVPATGTIREQPGEETILNDPKQS